MGYSELRNNGNGTFAEVSGEGGVQVDNPATALPTGKALSMVPIDIDDDGWFDLFVGNDTVQNFFFHNQGDGKFQELGTLLGVTFDRNGSATGAMGVDAAHYRNDNELGFAVRHFANEMTFLHVSQALVIVSSGSPFCG